MCFMDMKIAFDGVPRRVLQWAMWKKEIPVLVRSVLSLYKRGNARVRELF